MNVAIAANGLPKVNILREANRVLSDSDGKFALTRFMLSNARRGVYRRDLRVDHGSARLKQGIAKFTGFIGLSVLPVIVAERRINGGLEKVQYSWEGRSGYGWLNRACSAHVVARKEKGGDWGELQTPEEIFGPAGLRVASKRTSEMVQFLLRDTGNELFKAPWKVNTMRRQRGKADPKTGLRRKVKTNGYLVYVYRGKFIYLRGFRGYAQVFRVICQESNRKIADFYESEEQYNRGKGFLGRFCLARKTRGRFRILRKPEIIIPVSKSQEEDLAYARTLEFVLKDQPADKVFVREKWSVNQSGSVCFGRALSIHGFSAYMQQGYVYAEIRQRGDYKVATFWGSREEREKGAKPIPGRQNIKIAKKEDGEWKIIEKISTPQAKALRDTNQYEEYLFKDQRDKKFRCDWNFRKRERDGACWLDRMIAGEKVHFFGMAKIRQARKLKKMFSVTYEVGGCLKVVEFYPARADYRPKDAAARPFRTAVIAFKNRKGNWQLFKGEFEQREVFLEDLIARLKSPIALERATKFRERYPEFAQAALAIAQRLDQNDRIRAEVSDALVSLHGRFRSRRLRVEDYIRGLAGELDRVNTLNLCLPGLPRSAAWMRGQYYQIARAAVRGRVLSEIARVVERHRPRHEVLGKVIEKLEQHFPCADGDEQPEGWISIAMGGIRAAYDFQYVR